jgi:hypothetical protein
MSTPPWHRQVLVHRPSTRHRRPRGRSRRLEHTQTHRALWPLARACAGLKRNACAGSGLRLRVQQRGRKHAPPGAARRSRARVRAPATIIIPPVCRTPARAAVPTALLFPGHVPALCSPNRPHRRAPRARTWRTRYHRSQVGTRILGNHIFTSSRCRLRMSEAQ